MSVKELPERSTMDPGSQWRLEDMFASNEQWETEFSAADGQIGKAAAWAGKLGDSAGSLLGALEDMAAASLTVERLYVYSRMRRDEDNSNSLYQGMSDRAGAISVKLSSALSYFDPEILAIDQAVIDGFFAAEPKLARYRHMLEQITRRRAHTLSASEENLLAMAGEVLEGPRTIFTMLNNADLQFPVIKDGEGNDVQITHGRFIPLMENADRAVRKAAFEGLYSVYSSYKNTIASSLAASVKGDVFEARARSYPTALEASLFPDAVPAEVYDRLIATVRENLPALHRYMRLRKRVLGVDELHMYDLYVPMVGEVDHKLTYAQSCALLTEGLAPLGGEYVQALESGLKSGWVDVYENRGKTSGAYSWGVWGTHPYVLLNWNDTVDNAFTLAHEMGHAMHSYLSDTTQPYVLAQYPILLAEIASTCNEYIFMDFMLKRTTDKRERLYLLNYFLEQIRTTVIRQVMFAEFEKKLHAMQESGEPLTAESISAVYRQLNIDYYGPDMVVDSQIDMEWARIPHFYGAFYVYKYATGFASAVALGEALLHGEEGAHERYLKLLSSGGSDYPLELLKQAGVDLTKPDAVQACLGKFADIIDEMEKLI